LHHYKLKLPTFKIKFIYIKIEVIGNEIWDLNKEIQRYKGSNVKEIKNNGTKVYIYKPLEQHIHGGKDIIFSSISI